MKNVLFLQARLNSKRLPNKVLLKIKGKTILEHIVNRLKLSKKLMIYLYLLLKVKKTIRYLIYVIRLKSIVIEALKMTC